MELLQLRYFYESARDESFSKTARAHMVPITSVSASIKRLEQELDCRLFERSSNRVRLSEEGKRFYESVRELFAGLDNAVANLKPAQEEKPVRILVLDMRPVITNMVIRYRELYPTAVFYMTMNRKDVNPEDYDIIIDEQSDRYPDRAVVALKKYKLRFCCSGRNPICTQRLMLRDLASQNFVAFEEDGNLYRRLLMTCEENGFKPRIMAMCNDVRCYLQLLVAGVGVALLKEETRPLEGTRYLDVADFDQAIQIMAYYRPNSGNKKVGAFVEYLRKAFTEE